MAGRFDNRICFVAGRIFPVRVGVVIQQVIGDSVNYHARRLGATGSVEVGYRVSVVHTVERRKLLSDFFSRYRRGCVLGCGAHQIQSRNSFWKDFAQMLSEKMDSVRMTVRDSIMQQCGQDHLGRQVGPRAKLRMFETRMANVGRLA